MVLDLNRSMWRGISAFATPAVNSTQRVRSCLQRTDARPELPADLIPSDFPLSAGFPDNRSSATPAVSSTSSSTSPRS